MIDIQVFDNTENIDLKVAPTSSIPVATETGFKGDQGDPGPPGPPGQDGSPGRDGEDGAPGRDGVDGAPGRDGVDGAPGRDGVDGEDGNGISSITKTGSATVDGRVVDTYTITFTDSTPTTFTVTNGKDGSGAVISVNGQSGTVVLDASDVGALPDTTSIPSKTSDLQNDSGFITLSDIPPANGEGF